ncbi:23S rRNA (uridine2552-2'-O)-methyltransferase [Methanomicrobium sp. W14]|uniref:RlmE family RNA methyltransferase n=1 Tax=Methanomicrobium sp. W14 TaxID=2817839 RepID=UPI001AEB222C|nr:RlmE family RNA methyltransferase [Methanomicrobium sp. W14]MBP2132554.1 23S rRNA (uridine2552-2'-O)-methyltransferase [Methanomicrobium sp. W14]
MGSQWGADKYYRQSKREGYRSRAAYKILDIQKRFGVIREDDNVVDLGAAPGSWSQAIRDMTDGQVVAVDLNQIAPVENVITIRGDFTSEKTQAQVLSYVDVVNVVVCDAAPKLSGQKSYDQARAIGLCEQALYFACLILKPGGNFVVKSFQGEMFAELLNTTRDNFYAVKVYRTKATRRGSTEAYIIAKNFKGFSNVSDGQL